MSYFWCVKNTGAHRMCPLFYLHKEWDPTTETQRILRYFGENIMLKIKSLKSVLGLQIRAQSLSARQWAKRVFICALKVMCLPNCNQLLLTRHTWSCYLSSDTISPCLLSTTQLLSPKRVTKYKMLHLTPSRIIILRPFSPDTPTGRELTCE
jgi:hypothetical protein